MIEYLKENYKLLVAIISLLTTIIIFIISIIRAVKEKKFSSILSFIPLIINEAESIFKGLPESGTSKLQYVMNTLRCICAELKQKFDSEYFQKIVEGYLSTPQKNK